MNEIFIQFFLGVIQGITEWLPISSSGIITLINLNFFKIENINELIHIALFLHLGTFFAVLVYFRKDVSFLIKSLFNYKKSDGKTKKTLNFLIISTIISGLIGLILIKLLIFYESQLKITGKTISFFIAFFLLITGIIQLKVKCKGLKKEIDLKHNDSILLGITQGLSSLPGISRSGITISTLLLKKFDDTTALRLSFLMSLPIILIGNIFLNFNNFIQIFTYASFIGVITSFIFGLTTISILMKLSKKINFGWFILIFSLIMFISLII